MKPWKNFCATAAVLCLAGSAQAATYAISGALTGIDVDTGPWPFDNYDVSLTPSSASFSGVWDIDPNAGTLSGNTDFAPYQVSIYIKTGDYEGTMLMDRPHDTGTIAGGIAFSYDPITRQLTFTNALSSGGGSSSCTATGSLSCPPDDAALPLQSVLLQLTFADDSLRSFSGTQTITRLYDSGIVETSYSVFSGTAVPVPAAAWLFGSGVLGLAGLTRRRK